MAWQWHQLDDIQIICTSLQTHASSSSLISTGRMLFLMPNQQCQIKREKRSSEKFKIAKNASVAKVKNVSVSVEWKPTPGSRGKQQLKRLRWCVSGGWSGQSNAVLDWEQQETGRGRQQHNTCTGESSYLYYMCLLLPAVVITGLLFLNYSGWDRSAEKNALAITGVGFSRVDVLRLIQPTVSEHWTPGRVYGLLALGWQTTLRWAWSGLRNPFVNFETPSYFWYRWS